VIDEAVIDARPTPAIGSVTIPPTAAPSAGPAAPATPAVPPGLVRDLRLAAREIRGLLASRPVGLTEANQLRALADRLETHAQTLERS
jgi:hypothetical protein